MRVALFLLVIVPTCFLQFLQQAPRTEMPAVAAESQSKLQTKFQSKSDFVVSERKPLSVEEQKIHKVLDAWVSQFRNMKSYAFEVQKDELDAVFKKTKRELIKAKIMKGQQDQYSLKYEICDDKGKSQQTVLLANSKMINLYSATRQIYITGLNGKLEQKELFGFANFVPIALPVFLDNKSDVLDRFTVSVVQEDSNYLWMKLIPKTDEYKRSFGVMQIGVVKYANQVSPGNFPLVVQFRDPSGNEIACRFTKVGINKPDAVKQADFEIDEFALRKDQWKVDIHKSIQMETLFKFIW